MTRAATLIITTPVKRSFRCALQSDDLARLPAAPASRAASAGAAAPAEAPAEAQLADLECVTCLETLSQPVTLGCGHSLCRAPCLSELARGWTARSVACPTCRAVAPEPHKLGVNRALCAAIAMVPSKVVERAAAAAAEARQALLEAETRLGLARRDVEARRAALDRANAAHAKEVQAEPARAEPARAEPAPRAQPALAGGIVSIAGVKRPCEGDQTAPVQAACTAPAAPALRAALSAPSLLKCSACAHSKSRGAFSQNQLLKSAQRRCRSCVSK